MADLGEQDIPLVLIGSGGHAVALLDAIQQLGRRVLFATDSDPSRAGCRVSGVEVRGGDELILDLDPARVRLVNAIGSVKRPVVRQAVYEAFVSKGYRFATIIHPSAVIARSATLSPGCQIMAGAVIQAGVHLDEDVLINTRASVDHECSIGAHSHVAPGATLSGFVKVGAASHIGAGATVIQGVTIGAGALVGAGAVVLRNLPPDSTAWGVPAKLVRPSATAGTCNIMLSASGRRVGLMQILRSTLGELDLGGRMIATDVTRLSPTFPLADEAVVVPRYRDPNCLDALLDLCRRHEVRLIVPTIDPELAFYDRHRDAFAEVGAVVAVSGAETIEIGCDKVVTHAWLKEHGFPTIRQAHENIETATRDWPSPIVLKPRFGSSSIGFRLVSCPEELRAAVRSDEQLIAQSLAPGVEYTVDVYVDRSGKCRCAVPRRRLETRAGEVSKGMTVRQPAVQDLATRIAEALPGAFGVLNIQVFHDEATGELNVIEINPRFGGGYPLTHEAGAPMARWLIQEVMGMPCDAKPDEWRDGLVMLRYDQAVFINRAQAGI